jgi:hypothetical protein
MREIRRIVLFTCMGLLLNFLILVIACASGDEYKRKKSVGIVNNPTYREQCGSCHFAYQPALLPSGSWGKILSRLADHNEESVVIEESDIKIIKEYLEKNAAEHSSAKRAIKILKSLDGQKPEKITDVPYIRRKHDDVKEDVFKRESIGSPANCVACHTTAEDGVYEDDNVRIPD